MSKPFFISIVLSLANLRGFLYFYSEQLLINKIAIYTKILLTLQTEIEEKFDYIEAQKGDILLEENNRVKYLYFIETGILYNYYYHDEKEITSWFYAENNFVTAWNSFYTNQNNYEQYV